MSSVRTWRRISIVLLIAILVQDLFTHRRTLKHSAEFSVLLQKSAPAWMTAVADAFDRFGLYWLPLFMLIHLAYTKNRPYWLHLFTITALPFGVTAIIKALYYRGRPFVIDPRVNACACDPGMPSSQVVLAVSSCYVAQKLVMDNILPKTGSIRRGLSVLLTILNLVICFSVSASRLILGKDGYIHILTGILICLISFLNLRQQDFKWFLNHLLPQLKPIFGLAMFLHALFIPVMIYINYYYRSDPWWKYWSKCETCGHSWIVGMCESLAIVFGFYAVFYFLPTKVSFRLQMAAPNYEPLERSPASMLQRSQERLPTCVLIQRILLLLLLLSPMIIAVTVAMIWIRPVTLMWSIPLQGILFSVLYGLSALYGGFVLVNLSVDTWDCCGVATEHDIIDPDLLENELPSDPKAHVVHSQQDWDARSGTKREEFNHTGDTPTNKSQELSNRT